MKFSYLLVLFLVYNVVGKHLGSHKTKQHIASTNTSTPVNLNTSINSYKSIALEHPDGVPLTHDGNIQKPKIVVTFLTNTRQLGSYNETEEPQLFDPLQRLMQFFFSSLFRDIAREPIEQIPLQQDEDCTAKADQSNSRLQHSNSVCRHKFGSVCTGCTHKKAYKKSELLERKRIMSHSDNTENNRAVSRASWLVSDTEITRHAPSHGLLKSQSIDQKKKAQNSSVSLASSFTNSFIHTEQPQKPSVLAKQHLLSSELTDSCIPKENAQNVEALSNKHSSGFSVISYMKNYQMRDLYSKTTAVVSESTNSLTETKTENIFVPRLATKTPTKSTSELAAGGKGLINSLSSLEVISTATKSSGKASTNSKLDEGEDMGEDNTTSIRDVETVLIKLDEVEPIVPTLITLPKASLTFAKLDAGKVNILIPKKLQGDEPNASVTTINLSGEETNALTVTVLGNDKDLAKLVGGEYNTLTPRKRDGVVNTSTKIDSGVTNAATSTKLAKTSLKVNSGKAIFTNLSGREAFNDNGEFASNDLTSIKVGRDEDNASTAMKLQGGEDNISISKLRNEGNALTYGTYYGIKSNSSSTIKPGKYEDNASTVSKLLTDEAVVLYLTSKFAIKTTTKVPNKNISRMVIKRPKHKRHYFLSISGGTDIRTTANRNSDKALLPNQKITNKTFNAKTGDTKSSKQPKSDDNGKLQKVTLLTGLALAEMMNQDKPDNFNSRANLTKSARSRKTILTGTSPDWSDDKVNDVTKYKLAKKSSNEATSTNYKHFVKHLNEGGVLTVSKQILNRGKIVSAHDRDRRQASKETAEDYDEMGGFSPAFENDVVSPNLKYSQTTYLFTVTLPSLAVFIFIIIGLCFCFRADSFCCSLFMTDPTVKT